MPDMSLLLEAERRGILPPDKAPLLQEARRRGLVPGDPGAEADSPALTPTPGGGALLGGLMPPKSRWEKWGPTVLRLAPILAAPAGPLATGVTAASLETLAEEMERAQGRRPGLNPTQIATQGLLGLLPGFRTPPGITSLLAKAGFRAGEGALFGGAATQATQLAETGEFAGPKQTAVGAGIGAGLGFTVGGASEAYRGRSARNVQAELDAILGPGPENPYRPFEGPTEVPPDPEHAAFVAQQQEQAAQELQAQRDALARSREVDPDVMLGAANRQGKANRAYEEYQWRQQDEQAAATQAQETETQARQEREAASTQGYEDFLHRQQAEQQAGQAEAQAGMQAAQAREAEAGQAYAAYLARQQEAQQAAALRQALYSDIGEQLGPPQPATGPRSLSQALAQSTQAQRKPLIQAARGIAEAPIPPAPVSPQEATSSLLEQAAQTVRGRPAPPESASSQLLRLAAETLRNSKGSTPIFGDIADAIYKGSQRARRIAEAVTEYGRTGGYWARRSNGLSYVTEIDRTYLSPLINAQVEGGRVAGVQDHTHNLAESLLTSAEERWVTQHGADAIRDRTPVPDGMPNAARYVQAGKHILQDLHGQARAAGQDVGEITNYFPQRLTDQARKALLSQKGPIWEAIKRDFGPLVLNPDELTHYYYDDVTTRGFGSFKERTLPDLPSRMEWGGTVYKVLEDNPLKVLPEYIHGAGKSIGIAKVLGPGPEAAQTIRAMQQEMRTSHPNGIRLATRLGEIYDTLQGVRFTDPIARGLDHPAVSFMAEVLRAPLVGLSLIDNVLTGLVPAASRLGIRRTLSAALRVLPEALSGGNLVSSHTAELLAKGEMVGAWVRTGTLERTAHSGFEEIPFAGTLRQTLRKGEYYLAGVGPLDWVNKQINRVSSVAAHEAMDAALLKAKAGDGRMLLDLAKFFNTPNEDIARWLRNGFSELDYARFMRLSVGRFNLQSELAVDVPRFFKHPVAREFLAFTSFIRAMGTLSYQSFGAATRGNFKPILTLLGGMYLGSQGAQEIKDWLKGKTHDGEPRWHAAARDVLDSTLLGLWGKVGKDIDYAMTQPGITESPVLKPLEGTLAAPAAGRQLDHLLALLTSTRPAEENVRRMVPLYDAIAHAILGEPSLQELSAERKRHRGGGFGH